MAVQGWEVFGDGLVEAGDVQQGGARSIAEPSASVRVRSGRSGCQMISGTWKFPL